ncbi:glutamate racemase [Noviherbaspirillum aridicola]|uniref:Glutamate racemase n=1 Tax=Noviherbaspirillum aridicola TaxID=2849687 RepID=A0ABQ4Q922_9BURK|nr:glutamate racemase [Noviherbaspirillum aridicola]GIZ53714.1 glutamate racemase [Noviherbaspirillum aridicola]
MQPATPVAVRDAPIGVFDSGIGGLSVLKYIRSLLPHEDLLYFADSGHAPYGGRSEEEIVARSLGIAEFLLQQGAKALVVACNTATAAAIRALRERWPALIIVGVEPGLKPAAAKSRNGVVGVMATRGTLASARFAALREQLERSTGVRYLPQPCVGLADQVEKGELHSAETAILLRRYLVPLVEQGADTLVLGCTHYPFLLPLIEEILARLTPRGMSIVDTGEPVARQLARLLEERGLLRQAAGTGGEVRAFTTGSGSSLATAFSRLLGMEPPVTAISTQ